ncbi:vWA domain-containing protein [Pengzhenrongella frigida]|uniref:VWA domain-containing protein n=1 Tax=Pengzhenrongella frigida TaxID=1259133 RepID=A0A4Q5N6Z6_9MICO|nr:VWA domain-containing protein [Cellulomonas sp. HLT2-17]RYV52817.1 VWA domain-containing protein [Cellulomonas sp. HLT2-17]
MRLVWPAALGLLVIVGVAWLLARRRAPRPGALPISGSAWVARVPQVRRWLRRYRALRVATAVTLVAAAVSAAVLASRPVEREVRVERLGSRDIVLCLDVSGSMTPFDSAIVETFARLVDSFAGERIALSVFNSTSRTVFPLTDDYTLALEELDEASGALAFDYESFDYEDADQVAEFERLLTFLAGTEGVPDQSSLIGDGLAACALQFDEQATDRSRSIILATDNYVSGEPLYTLAQAVELVDGRDVSLVGLFGGEVDLRGGPQESEYREEVLAVDGLYFTADDPAAIEGIVADVQSQQAVDLDAAPEVVDTDRPKPWFGILAVAVVALVLLQWRLRS